MKNDQYVCPLCKGDTSASLAHYKCGYNIYSCRICKLKFVYPQPGADKLREIYSVDYFQRGGKYTRENNLERLNENEKKRLTYVQSFCNSGELLDVGCAQGDFLKEARKAEFSARGVEYSPYAAEKAASFGLNVKTGTLFEAGYPSEFFSVVTLWDVLEHVTNPESVLAEVHRILKPGGYIFISTGNITSKWARFSGRFWQLLTPPQHLFFFSKKSISNLLSRTGYTVKEIKTEGRIVPMELVFLKAKESLGFIITPLCALAHLLGLDKRCLNINLGDIMVIAASKK